MKIWDLKNMALLLAAAMLILAGCPMNPDEGEGTKNRSAFLTAISIAGTAATVAAPVPGEDWSGENFSLFDLGPDQLGQVVISQSSALTDAQIEVTASAGAEVKYAAADFDVPGEFQAGNSLTLANNGYLCIQVTSEDGKTVNYYVVEIKLANAISSLTRVTFADIQADLGTPNAAWDQAGAGSVGLSVETQNGPAIAVTKSNNQTVKFAKVTGTGAPSFDIGSTFNFVDGDFLYIEVTAENGINKSVYKIEIQIGRDTSLSSLSLGGVSIVTTGVPAATLAEVVAGTVLFNTPQPDAGYAVAVTSTDSEAAVTWAAVSTDTNTAAFGTTSPLVFTDQGYLYIKVVSANTTTTAYYKIQVNLMRTGTIKYGQPVIKASAEKYIDPVWDLVTETYSIAKVYATDSTAAYIATPTTTGVAKALFDASGLYVYVTVTDPVIDTTGSSTHTKDSVELFINEGVDSMGNLIKSPVGYDTKGGQYRVDAAGATSGDPAAAGTALSSLNKISAWTTETGYVVIFQAPWRFTTQYPLAQGKKIGFELQINACSNGGRDGVMVWNNIAHTNYQNVSDYGEATLDLDGNSLAVNAKAPVISTHPLGAVYIGTSQTAAALSVSAASQDGGDLSYQWYSNTANSYVGGTPLTSHTGLTYMPDISTDSSSYYTTYYWVEVTNTIANNGDGGIKAATAQSGIAGIVVSSVPLVEKIVAGSCGVPVYRFTLPNGKTWSDYKEMTYTVMISDNTTLGFTGNQIRSHIVGNYTLTDFGANGEMSKLADWGPDRLLIIANNVAISNVVGVGYQAYTWKELKYSITSPDSAADKVPAGNAVGPFYLGIGFAVNQTNAAGQAVTYYVKDVALVGNDDSKLLADPLDTVAGSLTLGQLKVRFQEGPGVTRTLEPEPTAPSGE